MFGFSFAKLIVLVAVVAAVWYGFKYLQARERQIAELARRNAERAARPGAGPGSGAAAPSATEDLVKCPVCATYVTRAARACGRSDCPY